MASNRSNNRTRRTAVLTPGPDGRLINRGWNNGLFTTPRKTADPNRPQRQPRTPAHVTARTMPDTAHRITRGVYGGHVNHGGTCKGCGAELGYWYHFQLCERCVYGGHVNRCV